MNSIVWSQTAQDDYWDNIDFLLRRWTKRESIRFINAVEKTIELLKQGQVTFKPTGYKNTYQITIVKQITLYYIFIEDNKIVLLRFLIITRIQISSLYKVKEMYCVAIVYQ